MSDMSKCDIEPCAFVKGIEKEQTLMGAWMIRMETKMDNALHQALSRPGWATTIIIGILSSAVVGLLVALVSIKP